MGLRALGQAGTKGTFYLIAHRYQAAGGALGNPKYAVTDEYTGSVGRGSDFRGGHLVWDPMTGSISRYT